MYVSKTLASLMKIFNHCITPILITHTIHQSHYNSELLSYPWDSLFNLHTLSTYMVELEINKIRTSPCFQTISSQTLHDGFNRNLTIKCPIKRMLPPWGKKENLAATRTWTPAWWLLDERWTLKPPILMRKIKQKKIEKKTRRRGPSIPCFPIPNGF